MQQPLHSRGVSVTLLQRADGRLDARATLLDLRKHGFVPVGGDLGTPGIVHLMELEAVIDPAGPRLDALHARQPHVAFESLPVTGGESCRDPVARLAALQGALLDASFARQLSAAQGGPRGCSHILSLAQVLVAAVQWALGPEGVAGGGDRWRAGERLFRRDILVDGARCAEGDLELVAQLTDLRFAPAPQIARPMDRFAAVHEVRIWAPVELAGITFGTPRAAERRRDRAGLDGTEWIDRTPRLAGLRGLSLLRGVSAALMQEFGEDPSDRPLLDALLMLAPTFIQVCGALSDQWPSRALAADSVLGMGGMPDSCYMWRRGGALDRLRSGNDPIPSF